jgi:ATP-dependent Clp protease ATP-binding subunit ClpA
MSIKKIVAKFINEVNELLGEKSIRIRLTESAVDHLATVGYDSKMGARPLARKINELIKVPLSKKMLFESVPSGTTVLVDCENGAITFDLQLTALPVLPTIDANGYIVLDHVES